MKKLLLAILGLGLFFGSCTKDEPTQGAKGYITDNDFTIEILGYEIWGDTIDDGITQKVFIAKGVYPAKQIIFTKNTQRFFFLDDYGVVDEWTNRAASSDNGFVKFHPVNYGFGTYTDWFDFTKNNQWTAWHDPKINCEEYYSKFKYLQLEIVCKFKRIE